MIIRKVARERLGTRWSAEKARIGKGTVKLVFKSSELEPISFIFFRLMNEY